MKQRIFVVGLVCILLLAMAVFSEAQEVEKKIRVGVYDNRAIAVAYFGSEYNIFLEKRAEHHEALATGDTARAKELTEWVERFQRQIHYQGFCRAPVDDLLMVVKDKVIVVAKSMEIDFIGWYPDYMGTNVETIDITAELVALFEPSEEKLKQIESLKGTEPTALADIEHDH